MSNSVNFSVGSLEKLFPFLIELDNNLRIIRIGPSLKKLTGEIIDSKFSDSFTFVRPRISITYDFQSFKDHQNVVVILQFVNAPIIFRFRGQFLFVESTNSIYYFGSPWITDVAELSFWGLNIPDFAIHDTIADNLQLLKSKEIVNDDMKRIAEELVDQRNELIEKNREVQEIAKFPDQNPQPILRISFENKLLYANQSAREKLIVEDVIDKLNHSGYLSTYLGGESDLAEYRIQFGDGVYEVTIISFKSDYYHNVYFRDITEKELFEKELLLSNSRFETLFKSLQSALIVEDSNRRIILANQEFCDLFGISIAPYLMKGMDCSKAAEESKHLFTDENEFVERINILLENRIPIYGDKLFLKDGRILERDFIPILEAGIYEGHIWRYQDITELLKTKESLQKVEEKYKKIIEDLEFGMIEVDLDQRITKVYPAFCRLTGFEESELIGSIATDLLAFKEDSLLIENQNKDRKKGVSGVYESRIKTKGGDVKWVIISGAPIYDWKSEIIGSIGIHIDITQRKNLEQELFMANEAAQASVKAREMFLANMSHEIRTPLNVIIGMSEILNHSELDFEKAKLIRSIHISANNLLNLVNDVLDFSKIDSGHLELALESINLNKLIEDISVQVAPQIERKGLNFISNIDPLINGNYSIDAPKLNQVLTNLIGNALKFTNEGTIELIVNVTLDTKESQVVHFSVKDTGIGINSENLVKIFDSFIQADSTVSRQFGGTGLGLSIAQSIVELMGGEIGVESLVGVGSDFHFEIELKKLDSNRLESFVHSKEDPKLKGLKILVAEDNQMNQLLIQTILKKEGADFDIVNNGEELIEIVNKSKYDLILMDIQMPVLDGLSATKELRTRGFNIPIIALTANAQKNEKENYLNSGFNAVITKPFQRSKMIATIHGILSSTNHNSDFKADAASYSIDELLELSEGDHNFVNEMLQTFVTNVPKNIESLEYALEIGDLSILKFHSHQIKPSLKILNINKASELAVSIEQNIDNGSDLNTIRDSITELISILKEVVNRINIQLNSVK